MDSALRTRQVAVCGAVRYVQYSASLDFNCHCEDCQHFPARLAQPQ